MSSVVSGRRLMMRADSCVRSGQQLGRAIVLLEQLHQREPRGSSAGSSAMSSFSRR